MAGACLLFFIASQELCSKKNPRAPRFGCLLGRGGSRSEKPVAGDRGLDRAAFSIIFAKLRPGPASGELLQPNTRDEGHCNPPDPLMGFASG